MKVCIQCGNDILTKRTEFCEKCYQRDYYLKNRERIKKRTDLFRRNHLDKHREYNIKYRARTKSHKIYYQKNKERMNVYSKKYQQKHRDEINERLRKKYKTDSSPFVVRCNRHRSLLKNALGNHTVKEWLFVRNLTHGICPSCNKFVGVENLTEDHVFSLNNFGTNYIDNIQALCHSCNCAKYNKNILYVGGEYVVKRDFNKMFDQTKVIAT